MADVPCLPSPVLELSDTLQFSLSVSKCCTSGSCNVPQQQMRWRKEQSSKVCIKKSNSSKIIFKNKYLVYHRTLQLLKMSWCGYPEYTKRAETIFRVSSGNWLFLSECIQSIIESSFCSTEEQFQDAKPSYIKSIFSGIKVSNLPSPHNINVVKLKLTSYSVLQHCVQEISKDTFLYKIMYCLLSGQIPSLFFRLWNIILLTDLSTGHLSI